MKIFARVGKMKITFLGAVGEVTGSRYLVEDEGIRILVDCGLFQGDKELSKRNWNAFPIEPGSIDAVILTHAHIDHSGYIPLLVKNGFKGKIYCSKATYRLCSILLVDSGSLFEENAKRTHENFPQSSEVPLYTKSDAKHSLQFFQAVDDGKPLTIGTSLKFTLIHSYHILGSSFVIMSDGRSTLTFSGDLGRPARLIMKSPEHLKQTDFLVLESTYGDRLHKEDDPIKILGQIINKTVAKGGMLVIPAFSVERAQTILYCLYQLKQKKIIPNIPIFLDSPMAIDVNNLFCIFEDEHKLPSHVCNDIFDIATYTRTVEESKRINDINHSVIIIAGSGMADGGRVLYHLKRLISDAKNTVVFVGFQAPGTLGHALIDGARRVEIFDQWYNVHAQIEIMGNFSAHADYNEILQWLGYFESSPKKVFITHGEIQSALFLKNKIEERFGWSVVVPKYLESFILY